MMKLNKNLLFGLCFMASSISYAEHDNLTRDAAIGGGLGGAAGGAIGAEVGGRDGAIIGSAAGAAIGSAIATDGSDDHSPRYRRDYDHGRDYDRRRDYYYAPPKGGHPHYRHCPPGQAKKGRC